MRLSFNVFAERDLGAYLAERLNLISAAIKNEPEEYVLNVSDVDYRQHLVEKFTISPPVLHLDRVTMDQEERMVPAENFPFTYHVVPGKSYPRPAYVIHVPVSGESHLFSHQPSTRLMWTYPVNLHNDDLSFELVLFIEEAARIRQEIDSVLSNLSTQLGHLCSDVNGYNMSLPEQVQRRLQVRKDQILEQRSVVDQIGIPLRKSADVPKTFAVPSPEMPRKITPKPAATATNAEPEPTLADTDYQEILKVVHDLGVSLERHPSTYEGKGEEDLRDYLLLLLQPQFEGSATGETFNKSGKTDILLRYQNHNIFIAECKFWAGIKSLFDATTQLLSYLTWRDSKAALVLFVRNKKFTEVLETIEQEISRHPHFSKLVSRRSDAWIELRFKLPDDESREVTVSILAFHLPPSDP
jgi:hypothetical protein